VGKNYAQNYAQNYVKIVAKISRFCLFRNAGKGFMARSLWVFGLIFMVDFWLVEEGGAAELGGGAVG